MPYMRDANGVRLDSITAVRTLQLGPALGGGQSDTAWINTVLAGASGARVRGLPGQTYTLGAALRLPAGGNVELDMGGCTITGPASDNFLKNYAADPIRTVADGTTLASSATIPSLTAAFSSGDVGNAVGVLAAGTNVGLGNAPNSWYGTVSSVVAPSTATAWAATTAAAIGAPIRPTTANGRLYWATTAGTTGSTEPTWPTTTSGTVTDGTVVWTCLGAATAAILSTKATLAVSNATINVFGARDTGITITGGTWNGQNKDSINQTVQSHGFLFRRLDGLNVRNLTMTSPGTGSIGGRYAICMGDITRYRVDNITFSTAGDGVHTLGPASYGSISNIYGTTGDDMVAFTTVDGQSVAGSLLGDVQGQIAHITVQNVFPNGSWRALKIAAGNNGTNGAANLFGVSAQNLVGNTVNEMVSAVPYGGAASFVDWSVAGVKGSTSTGSIPLVRVALASKARLSDLEWRLTSSPSNGIVAISTAVTEVDIDGLYMASVPGSGTPVGVAVTANCSILRVRRAEAPQSGVPSFHLVQVGAATIGTLTIDGYVNLTGAGSHVIDRTTATSVITRALLTNGYVAAGALIYDNAAVTTAMRLSLMNWHHTCAYLVIARSPFSMDWTNCEITSSGAIVQATGASATPIRLRAGAVTLPGAGALLSRDGTQVLSVTGKVGLDISTPPLTPQEGDEVINSNAALSCGAGLVVYHSGGTGNGWKSIYAGSTY